MSFSYYKTFPSNLWNGCRYAELQTTPPAVTHRTAANRSHAALRQLTRRAAHGTPARHRPPCWRAVQPYSGVVAHPSICRRAEPKNQPAGTNKTVGATTRACPAGDTRVRTCPYERTPHACPCPVRPSNHSFACRRSKSNLLPCFHP